MTAGDRGSFHEREEGFGVERRFDEEAEAIGMGFWEIGKWVSGRVWG